MTQIGDVELSGSDYFLFAMDRLTRATGQSDSQCRMVVELNGSIDQKDFRDIVREAPILRWMANVRKTKKLPFTLPRWRSNGSGHMLPVTCDTGEQVPFGRNGSFLFFPRLQRRNDFPPPLSFAITRHDNKRSTCILNWDHTLMDAQGAEILLQHIAQYPEQENLKHMLPADGQILESRVPVSAGFPKRLSYARKSVHYISAASEMPIASLKPNGKDIDPVDQYCLIRFDQGETERIVKRCESMGLSYYHSLFFLAATLRAVHAVRMHRGEDRVPYLVPVPLNLRRKGGAGPAFSNNVSFLFYRITPEEIDDFAYTAVSLKKQMKEQIVQEIPYSYAEMMKILRRLPLHFYSKLLSGPTKGQFASFFYSYTGECCSGMETFMGQEVDEVVHLAPATSIPGLSVVFMRHRNCLRTILSLRDSLLNKEELALFEKELRKDLLQESDQESGCYC